jgi:type III pantothenate kinase
MPLARLVVDVGNTRIKWGLCDATAVCKSASLPPDDPAAWNKQLAKWRLNGQSAWALAGVNPERTNRLAAWLHDRGDAIALVTSPKQLNLKVAVRHPGKVGIDRLLNAVAVNQRRSQSSPAFIIDAGSAVTVDYVDRRGVFRGGAILPGLQLMATSLHQYTAMLPQIEVHGVVTMPGRSTEEAMNAGIVCAVAGGIRELIDRAVDAETVPGSFQVFFGGGDAKLLSSCLPFATAVWPEMTLEGLRIAGWPKDPR